jgi:hypothetical protein
MLSSAVTANPATVRRIDTGVKAKLFAALFVFHAAVLISCFYG